MFVQRFWNVLYTIFGEAVYFLLALQALERRVLHFLNPEGGSQKATLVVLVLVIRSLKIPKTFLKCSATKLCIHIRADITHRSTISADVMPSFL